MTNRITIRLVATLLTVFSAQAEIPTTTNYLIGTSYEPDWWPRLAVREGDWKLVLTDDTNRMELHRLSDDRAESTDLAKDYPDIVSRLAKLAFAWKATLPEKPDPECISKSNPASGNSPSKKAHQAMTAPD